LFPLEKLAVGVFQEIAAAQISHLFPLRALRSNAASAGPYISQATGIPGMARRAAHSHREAPTGSPAAPVAASRAVSFHIPKLKFSPIIIAAPPLLVLFRALGIWAFGLVGRRYGSGGIAFLVRRHFLNSVKRLAVSMAIAISVAKQTFQPPGATIHQRWFFWSNCAV
jgi:hypothetical protein